MISKKLGFNFAVQIGVKFMAVGLGFFSTRWLITNLSPESYSVYNLILAYNAVLLMALTFGLPQIVQKYYTNHHNPKDLANFWTTFSALRLFTYFLGILIILITYPLSQTRELGYILGLFSAQFILVADMNFRSVCDATGRAWQYSMTDFIGKLLVVIGIFTGTATFIESQSAQTLPWFIGVSIAAYSTTLIIDSIWQREFTRFGKFDWSIIKENRGPITYLTISLIAISVYFNTDRLLLAYFGADVFEINGYSNGYKFFEIASVLPGLSIPTIASIIKRRFDKGELTSFTQKLFRKQTATKNKRYAGYFESFVIALCIGMASFFGLFLIGPFAIQLVDPELLYPLAIDSLRILAFAHIPQSLGLMTGNLVVLTNGEKYEMYTAFGVAFLGMASYILLIPMFGLYGAAWATVFIYSIDFIFKLYSLNHNFLRKS